MKSVAFTEFRRHASDVLTRVESGETVVVLRHGRPIAAITPIAEESRPVPSWKRPGIRLATKGGRLAAAIIEERQHDRVL